MQTTRYQREEITMRDKKKDIPDGIWFKCNECGETVYSGELSRNLWMCPRCNYCFPLEPAERITLLADTKSFVKHDENSVISCPDAESCNRAIMSGESTLSGHRLAIAAINLGFFSEDISLFACENIVRTVAFAVDQKLPLLLICANSNGTQEQNSIFHPAQRLGINAALSRLVREKLLYISILANSNSYGDFPGFAYTADVVAVESNTPMVSRTGNQNNQNGAAHAAQTLFENGMVDMIVSRGELKQTLTDILNFFC